MVQLVSRPLIFYSVLNTLSHQYYQSSKMLVHELKYLVVEFCPPILECVVGDKNLTNQSNVQ